MDGALGLRLPGPAEGRWRLAGRHVVHVRESGMVRVRQVAGLRALDLGTGDGSGRGLRARVVRLEDAFEPATGAPVFRASRDPGEVDEGDAVAVGLDQGDEAAERDTELEPSLSCVVRPSVRLDVQYLDAVHKEAAYQAPAAGADGFARGQVRPDGVVGCPVGFPGGHARPRLGVAQIRKKRAAERKKLDVQKVSMAVVDRIAVDDAGGGPLGGLGCAENRDADAVVDRGSEGHVPFVLNGRPDLLHPRVIGKGHRSLQKIGIHRRMKEIAFQPDRALSLEAGRAGGRSIAELEEGFSNHRDLVQRAGYVRGATVVEEGGVVGFRVGVGLQGTKVSEVMFQVEQPVAVDRVVATRGLLGGAVREEVVGREDTQRVRPFIVDPIHHVPRVGAVQTAQDKQRPLAFSRKVAARAAIQRDLEQGRQHLLRQLTGIFGSLNGKAHRSGASDELPVLPHQRPHRVVCQRQARDEIRGVDAVADATLGAQRLNRIGLVRPVGLAPIPGFLHAFRRAVPELGNGGQIELFLGVSQQQQPEPARERFVETPGAQGVRKSVDSRMEAAGLIPVIGGGKEVDVTVGVEKTVPVVRIFARKVVFVRQVVAGIDRSAIGALGLEIAREMVARPGIKAAVFENRRTAVGAALVAVGKMGFGQFRTGKLRPGDFIRLRRPPGDGFFGNPVR